MTDVVADEKPKGRAKHLSAPFQSFGRYCADTETLVHLTHEGLGMAINMAELVRSHVAEGHDGHMDEERIKHIEWKAERARKEVEAGYPTLHAHSLLGLWGAFECLVEDIFRESIKAQPELLKGQAFAKVKLPISVLSDSEEDRVNAILLELTRNSGSGKKIGVGQFEVILKPVNLGGGVPDKVRKAVLRAQQVRHIWAHRAGLADAKFLEHWPGRAEVGERVNLDVDEFIHMMNGLQVYSFIIANRHLANLGDKEPYTPEVPGYEGVYSEPLVDAEEDV